MSCKNASPFAKPTRRVRSGETQAVLSAEVIVADINPTPAINGRASSPATIVSIESVSDPEGQISEATETMVVVAECKCPEPGMPYKRPAKRQTAGHQQAAASDPWMRTHETAAQLGGSEPAAQMRRGEVATEMGSAETTPTKQLDSTRTEQSWQSMASRLNSRLAKHPEARSQRTPGRKPVAYTARRLDTGYRETYMNAQ
jgi:hypothetical protein